MSVDTPTIIRPRVEFDEDVQQQIDEDGGDVTGEGWYCVRTAPFPCPADGCDYVAHFMTAAHRIVVWPDSDDPKLLREAHRAQAAGRQPRIAEYQAEFGPCIPWDLYVRLGRPVHAVRQQPPGWPPSFNPGP